MTEPDHRSWDEAAIWAAMTGVYDAFLAADPDRVDAVMHPQVTIWDSVEPGLVRGLDGLRELRSRRPAPTPDAPRVAAIEATEPVIDVFGDVAVLRHLLRVRFAGDAQPAERVRNTSVWRRVHGRWLAVHNHEDVLPG